MRWERAAILGETGKCQSLQRCTGVALALEQQRGTCAVRDVIEKIPELQSRAAHKGIPPNGCLDKHYTQRPEVRTEGISVAQEAFGGHVGHSADPPDGWCGAVCVKRQRIATGIYLHFPRQRGNAEVGQFCLTGCGKQNVARFEIAVHHLKVCMEELSAPSMSTATVASASCGIECAASSV